MALPQLSPSYARPTRSSLSRKNDAASDRSRFSSITTSPERHRNLVNRSAKQQCPASRSPLIQSTPSKKQSSPEHHHQSKVPQSSLIKTSSPHNSHPNNRHWLTIHPANPSKPCPFATLPPELREIIYTFALPASANDKTWPPLLRVCRRIRAEVAYTFYACTSFTFSCPFLNYLHIETWLRRLPTPHRQLLAQNRRLCIKSEAHVSTLDQPGARAQIQRGAKCYGRPNAFKIPYTGLCRNRDHFKYFCLLAQWCAFCGRPEQKGINWRYDFATAITDNMWARYDPLVGASSAYYHLDEMFGVWNRPCVVQRARLDAQAKALMKGEALKMIAVVKKVFTEQVGKFYDHLRHQEAKRELVPKWNRRMDGLKGYLEKW